MNNVNITCRGLHSTEIPSRSSPVQIQSSPDPAGPSRGWGGEGGTWWISNIAPFPLLTLGTHGRGLHPDSPVPSRESPTELQKEELVNVIELMNINRE